MHSVTLLLIVLYSTPLAAILWHTLSERLPYYQQTYFPNCRESESRQRSLSDLSRYHISSLFGFISTPIQSIMTTRYWDEIDWYIQEGTQKLCEMLKHEEDDNNSSKWSAGEEAEDAPDDIDAKNSEEKENPSAQELTDKIDKLTVKRESDADSEKEEQDEYMERSTSVEDQSSNIIKKQTNVEELQSLCIKCKMMSPIYTYFTTDDEQVVSTVQLWSGVRFSSRPHRSRDKAMEAAAYQGLAYLKYELKENRPISTSPPSSAYVTVHNVAPNQYYAPHPAFATPMSYATSPHAYYYPSTPYHVMPTRTVGRPDISPAAVIHPSYTVGPGHHVRMPPYQPFMQYPYLPVQVSPTHHSKRMPHYASMQPRTEFKILDKPPVPKETKEQSDQCDESNSVDGKATTTGDEKDIENKNKRSKPQRQQSQTKPKLAVSFTQAKK